MGDPKRVGTDPIDLAVGAGAVWVANSGDGTVTRIDERSGLSSTTAVIEPPPSAGAAEENGIAVGEGGVWVTIGQGVGRGGR